MHAKELYHTTLHITLYLYHGAWVDQTLPPVLFVTWLTTGCDTVM